MPAIQRLGWYPIFPLPEPIDGIKLGVAYMPSIESHVVLGKAWGSRPSSKSNRQDTMVILALALIAIQVSDEFGEKEDDY